MVASRKILPVPTKRPIELLNHHQSDSSASMHPTPSEPEILEFLANCASFYPDDAVEASIAQQRQWYDALCAHFDRPIPDGMVTEDTEIHGVRLRRYRPARIATEKVLYYIHGGGFVVGSIDSHHAISAELSNHAHAELVSVDYRLAPEHRWPIAHQDCFRIFRSLIDGHREVILIGDSAGGNLAAGLAQRARDEGLQGIAGQVLIYPALGGDLHSGSYEEMALAPGLTTADVAYYRAILGAPEDNPIAHPLKATSFKGLPPTFISSAYFDPLRDDGRLYAARLAEAGVEIWYREEPQMVHAWLRARHMSPGAALGFEAVCTAVARFLRLGPTVA